MFLLVAFLLVVVGGFLAREYFPFTDFCLTIFANRVKVHLFPLSFLTYLYVSFLKYDSVFHHLV